MSSFLRNQLTWVAEMGLLAGSVYWHSEGLLLIVMVSVWLSNTFSLLASFFLLFNLSGVGKAQDSETVMELLRQYDKRSSLRKSLTRIQAVILVMVLAYAGAPITAFCYAILTAVLYSGLRFACDRLKGAQA